MAGVDVCVLGGGGGGEQWIDSSYRVVSRMCRCALLLVHCYSGATAWR